MPRTLDVYLHRELVGRLLQDAEGRLRFGYTGDWLSNPAAVPISQSLPLEAKRFSQRECRGFFAGLLPDDSKREIIARNLGISARNDFAMLERIGGECAGAVTFVAEGHDLPAQENAYRPLEPHALAEMIRALPRRPLLAGEEGIRLSLAGAQDKIAVHVSGDTISLPLLGSPSTHILKPAVERFEGLVFNEAFCLRLARAVGLRVAEARIGQVEGIDYLLVERYDRARGSQAHPAGGLQREHQEDFCQALGIAPDQKYQAEGGPSLKQCFDLVRRVCATPVVDLQALLDAVIFNWLVGNNDAHGKNFSLLYRGNFRAGFQTLLAPLYDLVCTAHYPELSQKMAMKVGGEYDPERLGDGHFERMAAEASLARPLVKSRVGEMASALDAALASVPTEHPAMEKVAASIRNARAAAR